MLLPYSSAIALSATISGIPAPSSTIGSVPYSVLSNTVSNFWLSTITPSAIVTGYI